MEEKLQIDKIELEINEEVFQIDLLRCDLYSPEIPGNKYWKLKYNIDQMKAEGLDHLVTFGGAYSNHIAAAAQAGKKHGFKTTGIIRGEESSSSNHTLSEVKRNGMNLLFIDRETYRLWKKGSVKLDDFLDLKSYYLLPEGGSNVLAVKGCSEIMQLSYSEYDVVACPVGSGSTLAGIIVSSSENQRILGFSSLKNAQYLEGEVHNLLVEYDKINGSHHAEKKNWELNYDYHFGGFAKINEELVHFYKDFKNRHKIELDLIYTSKMMFGLIDLMKNKYLNKQNRIAVLHTGGIQGNAGFSTEIKTHAEKSKND